MDNNLTTLGKRENAVFILTPLYLVLFYFFRQFYLMDESGLGLLLMILHTIGFIVAVVAVLRFFRRIILPSKILEYDSMNLYVNKGLKGKQIIPWTDVRSVENLQVHGSLDAFFDAIRRVTDIGELIGIFRAAWDLSATGVIVLNCKGELVRVHGIKNAREVRNELHKIISSKRRNIENSLRMR